MDEQALIQATLDGKLDAFNQLVLAYQDLLYNRAYWMMGNIADAEDLTQDAFIKAYHSLKTFRGTSLRSWLTRIVTNTCYDELRRRKRAKLISLFQTDKDGDEEDLTDLLVDPDLSVEEQLQSSELSDTLKLHINALPAIYRDPVVLVDILELDYAEAAHSLGIPVGTVKSRLARARSALRERLSLVPEFQRSKAPLLQ
jgi:RNA polymerase sigma-70 factor, ECF subfamily